MVRTGLQCRQGFCRMMAPVLGPTGTGRAVTGHEPEPRCHGGTTRGSPLCPRLSGKKCLPL